MPAKREVVGLWPHFFMPSLARACLCHIGRSNDIDIFCCHIAQMRATTIASRAMTHNELIFMLYCNERTTIRHFSSYSERASNDHMVLQRARQCTSYCNERTIWNDSIVIRERSDDEKYIVHVVSQEATATSVFLRNCMREHVSHCKDETT